MTNKLEDFPQIQPYEVLKKRFMEEAAQAEEDLYQKVLGDMIRKTVLATERLVRQEMVEDAVVYPPLKNPQDAREEARRNRAFEEVKTKLEAAGWAVKSSDAAKFFIRRK